MDSTIALFPMKRVFRNIDIILNHESFPYCKTHDQELSKLLWSLGAVITEIQNSELSEKVIYNQVISYLHTNYPDIKPITIQKLRKATKYYQLYSSYCMISTLIQQTGWKHVCIILKRCSDPDEIEFYLLMVRHYRWSQNQLKLQLMNGMYTSLQGSL